MARNRRTKKHNKSRRSRGGGYEIKGDFVSPGNQVFTQYAGVGKDCAGVPERPGFIANYSSRGLPGLSGGSRRRHRGGTQLQVAPFVGSPFTNVEARDPTGGAVQAKPAYFPDTTGAGGTVAQPNTVSSAGVPTPAGAQMAQATQAPQASQATGQKGGRYGSFPNLGPAMFGSNGVGMGGYAPIHSIPCENSATTRNPLNMAGGAMDFSTAAPFSGAGTSSNFPNVTVGAADAMRYYAPTAGYRNDFEVMRSPSAVPGFTVQTPYAAGAFNQACVKTGGSRRKRRERRGKRSGKRSSKRSGKRSGGAQGVADMAGTFTKVQVGEVGTRGAFDGTKGGLPVKFGGSRKRSRRSRR